MKKTIMAIFVAFALCTMSLAQENWPIDVDRLIYAIAEVESGSNDEATGKNGEVGRYQITEKYLSDANRFLYENYPKTDKDIRFRPYTMEDMRDPNKAFEVVLVYLFHYSRLVEGEVTFETLARIHNGGPNGYKNPNTVEYWNKVRKVLEKNGNQ